MKIETPKKGDTIHLLPNYKTHSIVECAAEYLSFEYKWIVLDQDGNQRIIEPLRGVGAQNTISWREIR